MRIGTMFLGRVEPAGGHCIETKFFVLGVPLIPLSSVYMVDESGRQGIELPTVHGTSAVAGLVRTLLGVGMLIAGVFYFLGKEPMLLGLAIGCTLAWLWFMFAFGRLSDEEKAQRTVLIALTGIGAPPELLPTGVRTELFRELVALWERQPAAEGAERTPWKSQLEALDGLSTEELSILFALATHDDGVDASRPWRALSTRV
ncbi:MAG: hypothetical protein AAF938_21495 [Myxococcota bacterium]